MAWRHPGFSTHVGQPIPPENTHAIEDMASYVVRNPVSLKRLVCVGGQQAVIYRGLEPNPRLRENFVAMEPLERPQDGSPFRRSGIHSRAGGTR